MKIVTVVGARPQFIKAATLSRKFEAEGIREIIVHTGQHYDKQMSDIFFDELKIPKPDYQLEVASKLHGQMTGKMLEGVEEILLKDKPDKVLVYGDTNSTLAGALAASKLHIPIAHVEAGLRSNNMRMPEEINRIVTDRLSEWLFTPTTQATSNLLAEGVNCKKIHEVGDIMYDTILFYNSLIDSQPILRDLQLKEGSFILATIHRAENTNDPVRLNGIFEQLHLLSKEKIVVLPLHPRTKNYMARDYNSDNFKIIFPVGYFDMIALQKNSGLIITDSGGVQKEAYFNRKYCITMRNETEWVELVENGYNFLVNDVSTLSALVTSLWGKSFPKGKEHLYGNGSTAEKITELLKK